MNAKDIYFKTLKFSFLKMALGLVLTLIAGALLALFLVIGFMIGGPAPIIAFCIWMGTCYGVYKFAMSYCGYMIKAAHVAIISKAVVTGTVPDDMVTVGKDLVKQRFGEANVYFVVDKLVSGAVKQLQNTVGKIGGFLDFIPGADTVTNILQRFIGIALGYVDECCLGYTFINDQQPATKSACDGVCIYFQNIKTLLKDAAKITLVVTLGIFLAWVVPFFLFGLIFKALNLPSIIAVVIALLVAVTVKIAFIDSYMLVKMMVSYVQVAPTTVLSFDLYDKLCKLSGKFKELFNKAQSEVQGAYNSYSQQTVQNEQPMQQYYQQPVQNEQPMQQYYQQPIQNNQYYQQPVQNNQPVQQCYQQPVQNDQPDQQYYQQAN